MIKRIFHFFPFLPLSTLKTDAGYKNKLHGSSLRLSFLWLVLLSGIGRPYVLPLSIAWRVPSTGVTSSATQQAAGAPAHLDSVPLHSTIHQPTNVLQRRNTSVFNCIEVGVSGVDSRGIGEDVCLTAGRGSLVKLHDSRGNRVPDRLTRSEKEDSWKI